MTRQQGHFACDHAEFWPAAPARFARRYLRRRRAWWQPRHDLVVGPAKIEIDGPSRRVAKDREALRGALLRPLDGEGDLTERTGRQQLLAFEGRKTLGLVLGNRGNPI